MPLHQRRISRFRRKMMGPQPKLNVEDIRGKFTVLRYLGYSSVKPTGIPEALSQEHHWYRVRCECGTEETHTQQQLIDIRRQRKCQKCRSQLGTKVPKNMGDIIEN